MINLKKLRKTKDDDLLLKFPGYKRSELRRLKKSPAKILLFDIETAPINAFTWGLYNQDINIKQIKEDWFMLCWSAKWLFDKEIHSDTLTSKEAKNKDDKRITKSLWKLINEADIIVAHNLDGFDLKKANTRFLKHKLPHPDYFRKVDTLKVVRQNFKISSNKLDYICKFLGLNTKVKTSGFDLWVKCYNGEKEALKKMNEYCNNDVKILEELYLEIRPYIKNHPSVVTEDGSCLNCGSSNVKVVSPYKTQRHSYKGYRCKDCKALFHGTKRL